MSSKDKKPPKADKGSPFYALKELHDRMADDVKKREAEKTTAKKVPVPLAKGAKSKQPKVTLEEHEDEVASFHRMMSGVEPLANDKPVRAGADPEKNVRATNIAHRAQTEADVTRERLADLVAGGLRFEVTDDGRHLEGRRADTPPELLRKLRRGLFPVDAEMDLHGSTAEEAESKLLAFLAKARSNKERVVLVIHGKGEHSPGKSGILRGEIGAWLSQGRAARYVAAFASARADEGGEGATYVALAR